MVGVLDDILLVEDIRVTYGTFIHIDYNYVANEQKKYKDDFFVRYTYKEDVTEIPICLTDKLTIFDTINKYYVYSLRYAFQIFSTSHKKKKKKKKTPAADRKTEEFEVRIQEKSPLLIFPSIAQKGKKTIIPTQTHFDAQKLMFKIQREKVCKKRYEIYGRHTCEERRKEERKLQYCNLYCELHQMFKDKLNHEDLAIAHMREWWREIIEEEDDDVSSFTYNVRCPDGIKRIFHAIS